MTVVPEVIHESDKRRFVIFLDGEPAVLQYDLWTPHEGDSPRVVDFTHTHVPREYRNRGLAETLVRRGLCWAKEQGYEVKASCWYAARFLR